MWRDWMGYVVAMCLPMGAATPSTVTLQNSVNAATLGQPVRLTAAVTPPSAAGAVTFYDGSTILTAGRVAAGQAISNSKLLSAGRHT